MEKRVIATVAMGDAGQAWADISHAGTRRYAEACGADFFVLSGAGLKSLWPGFSKLLLGELLNNYDRMLYVDTDILISPDAPNIFELVPADKVGATVVDTLEPEYAPAVANGWFQNDIRLTQQMFGEAQWQEGYFNSGSLLFSKQHKCVFDQALEVAQQWFDVTTDRNQEQFRVFSDQSLFNYFVQANGFEVYDFKKDFNHTPAFNHQSHRYQSHFYHYVRLRPHRRGNRLRQMRNDAWIMRRPWLHRLLRDNIWMAKAVDRF